MATPSDSATQASTRPDQQRVFLRTADAYFVQFLNFWLVFTLLLTLSQALALDVHQAYTGGSGLAIGMLARWLVSRGRQFHARTVFVCALSLFVGVVPWFVNGIATPIIANQLAILIIAVWTLGLPAMRALCIAFALDLLALWAAQRFAGWMPPLAPRSNDVWLSVFLAQIIMVWITGHASVNSYMRRLQREEELRGEVQCALHTVRAKSEELESAIRSAKLSLAAVEAANDEMATLTQFNEAILQLSPLPIAVFDAEGMCVRSNAAYTSLMGAPERSVQAHRLADVFPSEPLLAEFQAALADQQPRQTEIALSNRFGQSVCGDLRLLAIELEHRPHLLLQFVDMREHRRMEQQLREMAFHDTLTGLPNRRMFMDRLRQAMLRTQRDGQHSAILYLDLNRFKYLNDTHGHEAGDLLLKEVATRLQELVRTSDTVARLGGDEFVVLLEEIGTHADQADEVARTVAAKIQDRLSQPYHLGDVIHLGSASIGWRVLTPADTDLHDVLAQADAAMYAQKKQTRATV